MTRPDTATKLATDVSTMFDEVSPRYDLINDVLSAGNSRLWRIAMTRALQPRKGMHVLDLAAGTGTASAAIAAQGARVTAADFSEGMLEVGRRRHADDELIDFVFADATQLPFADGAFDAATISFGLRNVSDPRRAIAEMRRVVKPGGRIVICEFSQPTAAIRTPYSLYSRHVLPRIAGAINRSAEEAYRYLNESIEQWPAQEELAGWLREAGLERVAYRNLTLGIVALHRGFVPRTKGAAEAGENSAPAKKAPARKPAAKKTAAKPASKRSAAKPASKTPAVEAPATEGSPARKPAAKKPAAKAASTKTAPAKTAPAKDGASNKPAAKKPAAKKPAAKKPAAAASAERKPAAKKAAPQKPAAPQDGAE